MDNILFSNKEKFEELEKKFKHDGLAKIHILADFDKTLTKAFVDGVEVPSLISILRDGNYLTPDYAKKAHDLYNKYHPLENDPSILKSEKKQLMAEWWTTHFELLIKSGLDKKDIEAVAKSGKIRLRDGFKELADFLRGNKIPLVIISSSGLGKESISLFLEREKLLSDNVHIISNTFEWDKDGKAVGIRQPIVHGGNKDETLVENFPNIFEAVRNRKNIILLGDSLGDIGMAEGFGFDNLLKIAFLDDEKKKGEYAKSYDILILNDGSLEFLNDFFKNCLTK